MPVYIDYHQLEEGLTIEDVREAHRSDLEKQAKYGVKFLQYWVNEKDSMVFCLIDGPDAEACVNCHLESHGNTPCNIQEVEPGIIELIMGNNLTVDMHHLTLNVNGEADTANRIVMVAQARNPGENALPSSNQTKSILLHAVRSTGGRLMEFAADQSLVAVFDSPVNAIECIKQTSQNLSSPVARFALYYGQPLTYKGSFFEVAIKHARILHHIAEPGQLVISNKLSHMIDENLPAECNTLTPKILNGSDEKFIIELFQFIEQNLDSVLMDVNFLTGQMGVSRTQLYRKITSLTGKTPNQLVRKFRMTKAFNLIRNREGNISFVSQEVGYTNPSYFSKIFRETFGCAPTDI